MTVDQWSDTMPLAMASIHSRIGCKTPKRGTWLCFVYKCLNFDLSGDLTETLGYLCEIPREVLQQIQERMEAIAKGIVSDHWS